MNPGKRVELEEVYHDDIGPKYFAVFEIYDSIFDWLTKRYGSLAPRAEFDAKKVQDGTARSDRRWLLPAPSEFRGQSTFLFGDDRENWSGWIASTSLGRIGFRMPIELEEQIGKRESGTFEVKIGVEIVGEMIFASDPEVSLVLLVPWTEGEANLKDYLFEYLGYLQKLNPDIRPDDFVEYVGEYLPSGQPEGWELEVSPHTIVGYPFEPGWFTLRLITPTSGKTFLAVKAIDTEDPSRFVVSEIIGIEGSPY